MGFKDFGSETLASTDVDNYLMKQANIRATVGAEPAGEEGMEVHHTNTDRVAISNGSAWVRAGWWSSAGRTGCRVQRDTVQSIADSTITSISWDTENIDTDAYIAVPSGTITVPAGLGGLYVMTLRTNWSASIGPTNGGIMLISQSGNEWEFPIRNGARVATATMVIPVGVGDTIVCQVWQSSGGGLNLTARLDMYRLGA